MSLDLLSFPRAEARTTFELLTGGRAAFDRILRRIDHAKRRIFMRCFDWRDDETGNIVARHMLHAADRGVEVTILKDSMGMHYEYLEATKQSFFHKKIGPLVRMQTWFLMAAYGQWGSLRQNANPLVDALLEHDNVTVVCEKRFDHSKLYIFDDECLVLGGMGIGDDFRWKNIDFMVDITGPDAVSRYMDRHEGHASFDPERRFDYLLHSFSAKKDGGDGHGGVGAGVGVGAPAGRRSRRVRRKGAATVASVGHDDDLLARQRLGFINSARERLTVEMAYMGDRRFTRALLDAVKRGVAVTLLTAERANVIADLNRYTCAQLLRKARGAGNLRVILHPRMVHGKAIVVDGERVDIGSANFTPLSHGGYEEVDLYSRDARFARAVEQAIERDGEDGLLAEPRLTYRRRYVIAERAIAAYQARARRRRRPARGAAPVQSAAAAL